MLQSFGKIMYPNLCGNKPYSLTDFCKCLHFICWWWKRDAICAYKTYPSLCKQPKMVRVVMFQIPLNLKLIWYQQKMHFVVLRRKSPKNFHWNECHYITWCLLGQRQVDVHILVVALWCLQDSAYLLAKPYKSRRNWYGNFELLYSGHSYLIHRYIFQDLLLVFWQGEVGESKDTSDKTLFWKWILALWVCFPCLAW